MTLKQRAEKAGVSVEAFVCQQHKKLGGTQKETAAALGVHQTTVSRILRENGARKWKRMTPEQEASVIEAVCSGEPVRSVAERFSRTPSAINKLVRKHGLMRQTRLISL